MAEDFRKLINEGNVNITLSILYHLCSFFYFNGRCKVCAGYNDTGIHFIHHFCHIRC